MNLAEVAREVLEDLESRIEQVKGRVEVGELPVIDAEGLQMRQLLQNLIGNALKFRRPGRTAGGEGGGAEILRRRRAGKCAN